MIGAVIFGLAVEKFHMDRPAAAVSLEAKGKLGAKMAAVKWKMGARWRLEKIDGEWRQ